MDIFLLLFWPFGLAILICLIGIPLEKISDSIRSKRRRKELEKEKQRQEMIERQRRLDSQLYGSMYQGYKIGDSFYSNPRVNIEFGGRTIHGYAHHSDILKYTIVAMNGEFIYVDISSYSDYPTSRAFTPEEFKSLVSNCVKTLPQSYNYHR